MMGAYDFSQRDQTDDQREAMMLRNYEELGGAAAGGLRARAMVQGAAVEARGDARSVITVARSVLLPVAEPNEYGARVIISTDSGRWVGLFRGEY